MIETRKLKDIDSESNQPSNAFKEELHKLRTRTNSLRKVAKQKLREKANFQEPNLLQKSLIDNSENASI